MDRRFQDIATLPANRVFHVVFFPDRVYHAAYLNATRSSRYRYNVTEVRSKAEIMVLKGEVYLDNTFLTNFIRFEYRSSRLVESIRIKGHLLGAYVRARFRVHLDDTSRELTQSQILTENDEVVRLHYCGWTDAYQVELWNTLEAPAGRHHDFEVQAMMGLNGDITRRATLTPFLQDVKKIREVDIEFFEDSEKEPSGYYIPVAPPYDPAAASQPQDDVGLPARDNFYARNLQIPIRDFPSDDNTVAKANYTLTFLRNFFLEAKQTAPVKYENAMMDERNSDRRDGNIIEMRWLLQDELGSNLVFFHEVTIPVGMTEGTHQHIGSEELYYVVDGEGEVYLGEGDSAEVDRLGRSATVSIFGLDPKPVRVIPIQAGSVVFTKSGGIHGIKNTSPDKALKFVAFLYQSS